MTTFEKRKEGFENKFAHDEELRFKATARRNKLLGLWAAEKLGKRRRGRRSLCARGHSRRHAGGRRRGRVPQDPRRFRCRRSGPVGPPDPPHHGRTADRGRRADRSRQVGRDAWPRTTFARGLTPARRSTPPGPRSPIRWSPSSWRAASFDAVTLDMQHGCHSTESVMRGVAAITLAGKPAIVRIPVGALRDGEPGARFRRHRGDRADGELASPTPRPSPRR